MSDFIKEWFGWFEKGIDNLIKGKKKSSLVYVEGVVLIQELSNYIKTSMITHALIWICFSQNFLI